jgi:hypothetical protein
MTVPDRWHHEDGTHRGTAQSTDGHELELFEAGFRQHVADHHMHCPECLGTEFVVEIPATFKLSGGFVGFEEDDMCIVLRCVSKPADLGHFQVRLGTMEAGFVPHDALSTLGAAVDEAQDILRVIQRP